MLVFPWSSLAVSFATLLLGAFVYSKNKWSGINRCFLLLCLSLFVWNIDVFGLLVAPSPLFAQIWIKIFRIGMYLLPPTFFHFILNFTGSENRRNHVLLIFSYCLSLTLTVLNLTSYFDAGLMKYPWGYWPLQSPLYFFHIANYILFGGLGIWLTFSAYKGSRSVLQKNRMRYALISVAFPIAIGASNFLPVFQINFFPLGSFGNFLFVLILAYAIVKHQLLDIEVVVKKGVVYSGLVASVTGAYIVLTLSFGGLLQSLTSQGNIIIVLLTAFLIVLGYRSIESFLERATDKIFFRGKVDYRRALRKLSHDISFIIDLPELLRVIVERVAKEMRIESVLININNGGDRIISSEFILKSGKLSVTEGMAGNLGDLLNSNIVCPLVLEELENAVGAGMPVGGSSIELEGIKNILKSQKIEVVVPLLGKDGFVGLLCLGKKLSDESYMHEDIEFFLTFSSQASMAIENAKLYHVVSNLKDYNENILDSMAGGVIAVNNSFQITTFNRAAEKISSLASSFVFGMNIRDVFASDQELLRVISDALDEKEPGEGEEISIHKGGRDVSLFVRASTLRDGSSKPIGAIVIFNDLSKEKMMEEQLVRAERLAALGKFASSVVHEVRNPLVSIKTFFQYLNDDRESEEDKRELSQLASQEVVRIERLLENMLSFAKPRQPETTEVDLFETLNEVLLLLRAEIEENDIKARTTLTDNNSAALGDKGQLKQVFINLILNAIQAMPCGGELKVIVGSNEITKEVFVKVSDTGVGIPEEAIPRLFEPFYSTKANGTGMGLAVTYNIIKNHKGRIDVESGVGNGTTFTITLPVQNAHILCKSLDAEVSFVRPIEHDFVGGG